MSQNNCQTYIIVKVEFQSVDCIQLTSAITVMTTSNIVNDCDDDNVIQTIKTAHSVR